MKKYDMNLLERYQFEQKRKSSQSSPIQVYIAILVIGIVLIGAYSLKLVIDNMIIEDQIIEIQNYVESEEIVKNMARGDLINQNLMLLDAIETQALSLNHVFEFIPQFDSRILDIIYYERPTTIRFTKIEYSENTISLNMVGSRPSDASNYVLRLQRTQSFADVSYSGYTYDDTKGLYSASIICVMKGAE